MNKQYKYPLTRTMKTCYPKFDKTDTEKLKNNHLSGTILLEITCTNMFLKFSMNLRCLYYLNSVLDKKYLI